jgi:hypothetical protein
MSLYNMLFGEYPAASILLGVLGLTKEQVPRYRNCFVNGGHIVVHTRTGGGNREYYEEENSTLQKNEFYASDEDDEFDCTYANFLFRFPDKYKTDLEALESLAPSYTPSEQWSMFLESCNQPTP